MPARAQWIYTLPCGCPVGVAEGYLADTAAEAMDQMYDLPADRARAGQRGISAKLISWSEYDNTYYPMMSPQYQCPHGAAA